jgi:hypothetical protein
MSKDQGIPSLGAPLESPATWDWVRGHILGCEDIVLQPICPQFGTNVSVRATEKPGSGFRSKNGFLGS